MQVSLRAYERGGFASTNTKKVVPWGFYWHCLCMPTYNFLAKTNGRYFIRTGFLQQWNKKKLFPTPLPREGVLNQYLGIGELLRV